MAYGLAVEGDDGPFVGERVTTATTCEATATVGQARPIVEDAGSEPVIVVHDDLVVGDVDGTVLAGVDDDTALIDLLRPVPSTVRPSATVESLSEPDPNRVLVTSPDGRLLGRATVEAADGGDHHDHDHDHDHDHEESPDLERMEQELSEVMEAVAVHFGDREPSDAELRTFLRDRLVAEGRAPEEADQFMDELNDNG